MSHAWLVISHMLQFGHSCHPGISLHLWPYAQARLRLIQGRQVQTNVEFDCVKVCKNLVLSTELIM